MTKSYFQEKILIIHSDVQRSIIRYICICLSLCQKTLTVIGAPQKTWTFQKMFFRSAKILSLSKNGCPGYTGLDCRTLTFRDHKNLKNKMDLII